MDGWFGRCAAGAACGWLAGALVLASTAVHARQPDGLPADAEVPALGSAHLLAVRPQARMLSDGVTCELIAGILTYDGQPVEGRVTLYRGRSHRPFMELDTREDGLVVAHFDAEPNEVVTGRAYWRDPRGVVAGHSPNYAYGPRTPTQCRSGSVSLGEPAPIPSTDP